MEYREFDFINDIDEVVLLINENLDPQYTKEIILWKHFHNPFGKSIAMVALDKSQIVGVVFYMRYNFYNTNGELIKSIRPLDVCTDKNQRGKGIFKALLNKCLVHANDYQILFSTPNSQSYPEFIKLNWKPLNKDHYFCVGILFHHFHKNLQLHEFNGNDLKLYGTNVSKGTLEFIKWRYDKSYFVKHFVSDKSSNFIIYRISKVKRLRCIVLCDFIGNENHLNAVLNAVAKSERISIIYYLNNKLSEKINFLFIKKLDKSIIIYKENGFSLIYPLIISLSDIEGRL